MPVYFPGQAKNGDVTPNGAAASNGPGELRRSGAGVLNRARARTLKMTVVMVCVFIFCWTPYYVISMWWVVVNDHITLQLQMPSHILSLQTMFLLYSRFLVDKDSFSKLDSRLQQILYIFACTNSVADPFVYGFFNLRLGNASDNLELDHHYNY